MSRNAWYPPGSASATTIDADQGSPNTLANAWPVKITDGTDLALVNAAGELLVSVDDLPLPSGAATAANQVTQIAHESAIEAAVESIDAKLTNPLPVSVSSLPLPAGAATEAKQDDQIVAEEAIQAAVESIDAKLTNPLPVSGPLTDTQLRAVPVPVSLSSAPLPSGAALASKQATSDINVSYDYRSYAYVGATQKVDTITYKTGGSGGTTVALQTFGYDGSDRVTSITTTY